MTINEKKTFRLYRTLNILALGICLYVVVFVSPLKEFILPHLRKFVEANIDIITNILVVAFMVGSLALAFIVWWVVYADKATKSRMEAYVSQLVAKDYYKGSKRIDVYRAVKTAISKYSGQIPGEEDHGSPNVVTSPSEKVRGKLQSTIAKDVKEEEPEDTSDGSHKFFYPNGTVKKEVTYKNGKMDGVYRTYYEDGTLHLEKYFKDGLLHGVFKAYDEFGTPYFEITYQDGIKHGIENGYYKNGVMEYQEVYQNGTRVSRKTFDESGELKFKHSSEKETGPP